MRTKISDLRAVIAEQSAEIEKLRDQANGTADTGVCERPGLLFEIRRAGQENPDQGDRVRVFLNVKVTDHRFGRRWRAVCGFAQDSGYTSEQRPGFGPETVPRLTCLAPTWREAFSFARSYVEKVGAEYDALVATREEAMKNA